MMQNRLQAATILDVLAVTVILAVLVAAGAPSAERAREVSRRMVCSANLKAIGASAKVYAAANDEKWMTPPFKNANIDVDGIDYVCDWLISDPPTEPGQVGYDRQFEGTSETLDYPHAGSVSASATRAFWMLVRSGDISRKNYICPSSGDAPDPTSYVRAYHDFESYYNISYGYQVPFGPWPTRPREGADHRRIHVADKGPFYARPNSLSWVVDGQLLRVDSPPEAWREFNSPNHGGSNNGDGQNCLYADGAVRFQQTPIVGVDNDNIYTLMFDEWHRDWGRIHGEPPQMPPAPPYPGQDAFGIGPGRYSATDSLIYP